MFGFGRKKPGGYNNYQPPKPYKRSHKPAFESKPGSILGNVISEIVDLSKFDRIYTENGKKYYGKNDGENTTDYWDEDGKLEFSKPSDEYDENERDIEDWEKDESHREYEEEEERNREEEGYFD